MIRAEMLTVAELHIYEVLVDCETLTSLRDLAAQCGYSHEAVRQHLQSLMAMGLVKRREGKWGYVALKPKELTES